MTGPRRRWRRRYAHSASHRREPVFAITAGLLVLALCIPVAYRALSDDSDHRTTHQAAAKGQTSTPRTSSRSATSTTSTTPRPGAIPRSTEPTTTKPTAPSTTTPATAPIPQAAPGILIRVVPAVRDIQISVGGTLYTTSADGIVAVPGARGDVPVTYVGYSVSPPLQLVSLGTWSDGSTAANRSLDADGHGHVSLAINIRYRVTFRITGTPSTRALKATSPAGSLTVTDGSQQWVLAKRGERSGASIVARPITVLVRPSPWCSGPRDPAVRRHTGIPLGDPRPLTAAEAAQTRMSTTLS